MPDVFRRSRSLAIALVVLALSAGVSLATAPVFRPVSGPAAGSQAEEPEANENEQGEDADEQGEDADEQSEDANEPAPAEDAPEAPDAEDGTPAVGTHGELVSAAAAMETPAGFTNHGAFVSCVAKMKDVTLADVDWTTVTPEACGAAKDAAKAERDAAKAERAAQRDAAKAERAAQREAKVHGKSAAHAPAH